METAHLPNGTVLQGGKYKIVRFIGSGGFGCTYEGEHTMLQRRVAIKEFFVKDFCNRDETTSHVSVGITEKKGLVKKLGKKFVEEARFTAGMNHPNIARVSDVFEENGTAYYVMDYINGLSLDKLVKECGPLQEQTALKYIRQVADALAYVHSLNRLHLDVKPGNIIADEHDNAILIDFGASKQYDEVDGENTSTLMGKTPGYAPIEQMSNSVTTFTPATDIYALGATLYKLLKGDTPLDSALLASGETLAPLPSDISENTANAVSSAMKTNKIDRPENVEDFLSLLDSDDAVAVKKTNSDTNITDEETTFDDKQWGTSYTTKKKKPIKGGKIVAIIICVLVGIIGIIALIDIWTPPIHGVPVSGQVNGHEYVDLGLSVNWATCNIGAFIPSDHGNYYAWGETKTKSEYTTDNCITYGKQIGDIAGNEQYDVARANWGETWRMPTADEFNELVKKCTWVWTSLNGEMGYMITGRNGNSIFLPAAGWRSQGATMDFTGELGRYWSATPGADYWADSSNDAFCLRFFDNIFGKDWAYRGGGMPIRPVIGNTSASSATTQTAGTQTSSTSSTSTSSYSTSPPNDYVDVHEYVDLGLSVKWATYNVGASSPEEYGDYYAWGETKTKSEFTSENSVTYGEGMGTIAGKPAYDVARAIWGGKWRIPTAFEMDELLDKCDWIWTSQGGHKGYKVTSSNGNSIFLPATGCREGTLLEYDGECGYYWTATPYEYLTPDTFYLYFSTDYYGKDWNSRRYIGKSIRPVTK